MKRKGKEEQLIANKCKYVGSFFYFFTGGREKQEESKWGGENLSAEEAFWKCVLESAFCIFYLFQNF